MRGLSPQKLLEYKRYMREIVHMGTTPDGCEACKVAKQRRRQARCVKPDQLDLATKFAQKTSLDTHEPGLRRLPNAIGNIKNALVSVDEWSHFLSFVPTKGKEAGHFVDAMLQHLGPDIRRAEGFYSDGDKAFRKMATVAYTHPAGVSQNTY